MNVGFHLYFPTEAEARKAEGPLKDEGFSVEVRPCADGERWLALAEGSVTEGQFDSISDRVEALAKSLGGELDGYEEDA